MRQREIHRNTRQRKVILEAVEMLNCHPSATQVFDAVRNVLPRTSLSTVYRNLGILVNQGRLIAVKNGDKEIRYDHNIMEHYHIKCSVCGRITDVGVDQLRFNRLSLEKVSGFKVKEVNISLTGICPECAEQHEKEISNEH